MNHIAHASTIAKEGTFIFDQGMRLLAEVSRPKEYLSADSFHDSRSQGPPGERAPSSGHRDKWLPLDREQMASGQSILPNGETVSLHRMFVVTDAGMGKTKTLEWLRWWYSQTASDVLAIKIDVDELAILPGAQAMSQENRSLCDCFIEILLLNKLCQMTGADNQAIIPRDAALQLLGRLILAGRVLLLFDALDHAPDDAVRVLGELCLEGRLAGCRIVVASRPYALDSHWHRLFHDDEQAAGWRFVQLDEFTPEQQRRYLGDARYQAIPAKARAIFTVPRVLSYLRQLTLAELSGIQTVSQVYHLATTHMLELALGAAKSHDLRLDEARRLLAMIAFHMVADVGNFDAVRGDGPINKLQGSMARRYAAWHAAQDYPAKVFDDSWATNKVQHLAAMNDILDGGFLERGCPTHFEFRNRSLQEFFAALFMSAYCTEADVSAVVKMLYWEGNRDSGKFKATWEMLLEMPKELRNSQSWVTAAAALYRPGDGTVEGTQRSCELIYRSWKTMEHYAKDGDPAGAQASEVLVKYRNEFSRLTHWRQIFTESGGFHRWRVARSITSGFRKMPAGTFMMGSLPDEHCRDYNEPHAVTLSHSFQLHQHAVTNAQYELFDPGHKMRRNKYSDQADQPVIYVSWFEAWAFAQWVCWGGVSCGLPTEAQWEYACRAGSATRYCRIADPAVSLGYRDLDTAEELGQVAHFDQDYETGSTKAVCSLKPNYWGLYDMHGNVWEWCWDWHSDYETTKDPVVDPLGPDTGRGRVRRGGSWANSARGCRSSFRPCYVPSYRGKDQGFRLVRSCDRAADAAQDGTGRLLSCHLRV